MLQRECPICAQKREVGRGGKKVSALGCKMDMQTFLPLHLELRLWVGPGVKITVEEKYYKSRGMVAQTQAWVPYT